VDYRGIAMVGTRSAWVLVVVGLCVDFGMCLAGTAAFAQEKSEASATTAPVGERSVPDMLKAGNDALVADDLVTARSMFSAALMEQPDNPMALLLMGEVLRKMGPQTGLEAAEHYRRYLRVRTSQFMEFDGKAYFGMGMVYLQSGYFRLAKESLRRAYRLASRDPERVINLAFAHEGLLEFDEAVKLGKDAVALEPENAAMYQSLARFYLKARSFKEAVKTAEAGAAMLQRKLRENPADRGLLEQLRALQGLRLQVFSRQAAQDGNDPQLWLTVSRAMLEQIPVVQTLMLLDALDPAGRAAEQAPDDPAVRIHQARLLYVLGRTAEGDEALAAIRSAGKVSEALFLIDGQVRAGGADAELMRVKQFLEQPTTQPAR